MFRAHRGSGLAATRPQHADVYCAISSFHVWRFILASVTQLRTLLNYAIWSVGVLGCEAQQARYKYTAVSYMGIYTHSVAVSCHKHKKYWTNVRLAVKYFSSPCYRAMEAMDVPYTGPYRILASNVSNFYNKHFSPITFSEMSVITCARSVFVQT